MFSQPRQHNHSIQGLTLSIEGLGLSEMYQLQYISCLIQARMIELGMVTADDEISLKVRLFQNINDIEKFVDRLSSEPPEVIGVTELQTYSGLIRRVVAMVDQIWKDKPYDLSTWFDEEPTQGVIIGALNKVASLHSKRETPSSNLLNSIVGDVKIYLYSQIPKIAEALHIYLQISCDDKSRAVDAHRIIMYSQALMCGIAGTQNLVEKRERIGEVASFFDNALLSYVRKGSIFPCLPLMEIYLRHFPTHKVSKRMKKTLHNQKISSIKEECLKLRNSGMNLNEVVQFLEMSTYAITEIVRGEMKKGKGIQYPLNELVSGWIRNGPLPWEAVTEHFCAFQRLAEIHSEIPLYLHRDFGICSFGRIPDVMHLRQLQLSLDAVNGVYQDQIGFALFPRSDHNGAFEKYGEDILSLQKSTPQTPILSFEAGDMREAALLLFNASELFHRKGSYLLIPAHASATLLQMDYDPSAFGYGNEIAEIAGILNSDADIWQMLFATLEPDAPLIFDACSSGAEKGFAQAIAKRFGRTVYAFTEPIGRSQIVATYADEKIFFLPTQPDALDVFVVINPDGKVETGRSLKRRLNV